MGTVELFYLEVKQLEHEADNSSPSSVEVKKVAAIPPLPHTT
jgi:hypothetical protein